MMIVLIRHRKTETGTGYKIMGVFENAIPLFLRLENKGLLGQGSFGEVHKVKCGRECFALKVIKSENPEEDLEEAKLLKSLDHKNIVKVKDMGFVCKENDGDFLFLQSKRMFKGESVHHCILMELCDSDLKTKLKTMESVDPKWARKMTKQLLDGLIYLHENGVMHRQVFCSCSIKYIAQLHLLSII